MLRRKENGVIEGSNADLLIFERTDMGVTPDDFMSRMEKIEEFLKSSKPVFRCDLISTEKLDSPGETAETYGAHFKIPFMENRLILNTKYWIPEENLVIISGEGNKDIREKYMNENNIQEGKDYIVAITYISGYQFNPVYDEHDQTKVIGTHVIQLAESSFGGGMPQWMVRKGQPKGMIEGYEKLLDEIRK